MSAALRMTINQANGYDSNMCLLDLIEQMRDCDCPELSEAIGGGSVAPHRHLRCAAGHEVIEDGDVFKFEIGDDYPQHVF